MLRRLLAVDMTDIVNRAVTLDSVLQGAHAVCERLVACTPAQTFDVLDHELQHRLAGSREADPATLFALRRLNRDPSVKVEALAAEIGWSRKHLADRVRRETGVGPRFYARLRRFERLMACLATGTAPHWADLAAAHGFADQPHMVRELRSLSGLTPTVLAARLLPQGGGIAEA